MFMATLFRKVKNVNHPIFELSIPMWYVMGWTSSDGLAEGKNTGSSQEHVAVVWGKWKESQNRVMS